MADDRFIIEPRQHHDDGYVIRDLVADCIVDEFQLGVNARGLCKALNWAHRDGVPTYTWTNEDGWEQTFHFDGPACPPEHLKIPVDLSKAMF